MYNDNRITSALRWRPGEGRQRSLKPAVLRVNHHVLQTVVFDAKGRLKWSINPWNTKRMTRHIGVVVRTLTRTIKSMVTGQAPVTLEWKNTPGKKYKQTKSGTRIYHSWSNPCRVSGIKETKLLSVILNDVPPSRVRPGLEDVILPPRRFATENSVPKICPSESRWSCHPI